MVANGLPPALRQVIDAYRLHLVHDPKCPLDPFLKQATHAGNNSETTAVLADVGQLFRCLLQEERAAADDNLLPFQEYWSRPWFDEHIHDVVAVLLDDRFEVVRLLGSGGQGLVYLVRNRKVNNRLEALKAFYVKDHRTVDPEEFKQCKARFRRESGAAERLQGDDHVPMVYDVSECSGIYYFTMHYVEGETLREHLERRKEPIPPRQAAAWMQTVAGTLAPLHSSGHIHRDIKPSNLMIDRQGFLYLLDFGLIKITSDGAADLTRFGGFGTPDYIAPEQARDARTVSTKADIYSLGATFYHLLTGQVWDGGNVTASWRKQVPPALRELCESCLDPDPGKRPTAHEINQRLKRWLHGISRRQVLVAGGLAAAGLAGFTAYRLVPKSVERLRSEARLLRNDYIKKVFADRFEEGKRTILLDRKTKPGSRPDAGTTAHAAHAILSIPGLVSDPSFDRKWIDALFFNLAQPFLQRRQIYWAVQRDADGRGLGWICHEDQVPTADTVLWLTAACARAKSWCDDNEHRTVVAMLSRPPFEDYHRHLLDILAVYADPTVPGAWRRYAHQADTRQHSVHTSALALFAQVEAHRAGLPWLGGDATRLADSIRQTSRFLIGWTAADDGGPESAVAEVILVVHAALLFAQRNGIEIPAPDGLANSALGLLLADDLDVEDYRKQNAVPIQASLDAKLFKKAEDAGPLIGAEPLNVLWYPWAVTLASLFLAQDDTLGLIARNRLLHRLGNWVGTMGEKIRDYHESLETSCLADAILGLSFVESLT